MNYLRERLPAYAVYSVPRTTGPGLGIVRGVLSPATGLKRSMRALSGSLRRRTRRRRRRADPAAHHGWLGDHDLQQVRSCAPTIFGWLLWRRGVRLPLSTLDAGVRAHYIEIP